MGEQLNTEGGKHRAGELCADGIIGFVRWRADALEKIESALAIDPDFALPRLVKAWMLQSARDANFSDPICALISEVKQSISADNRREFALCEALELSHDGFGFESAEVLEGIIKKSPTDLLAHQLVQEELFWLGNATWMRAVAENAAPHWHETTEGYGSFLALRAFANEEAGCLEEAERFGRMAVEIDQTDIWGAHAVAHTMLMRGETDSGLLWLEQLSSHWGHGNQMRHHLWWHLCLFAFELGDYDRILELLTREVRNPESALVKAAPAAGIDITNFASLLMRLELRGVQVDEHWQALAVVCAERVKNHGNAFGSIHDMMVLAATQQFAAAEELLNSMRAEFQQREGSLARSYRSVAVPACEAMLAHRKKDYESVLELLGGIRHDLHLMGASHAQRDVFYQILVNAARHTGRADLCAEYLDDISRLGFCRVSDRAAYKHALN